MSEAAVASELADAPEAAVMSEASVAPGPAFVPEAAGVPEAAFASGACVASGRGQRPGSSRATRMIMATASGTEISTMGAGRKAWRSSSTSPGTSHATRRITGIAVTSASARAPGSEASRTPGPGCHRRLIPSRPMVRCHGVTTPRAQSGPARRPRPIRSHSRASLPSSAV